MVTVTDTAARTTYASKTLDSQGVWEITGSEDCSVSHAANRVRPHSVMWQLASVLSAHGGEAQVAASRRIWSSLADQSRG